jgi:hypothetical protein
MELQCLIHQGILHDYLLAPNKRSDTWRHGTTFSCAECNCTSKKRQHRLFSFDCESSKQIENVLWGKMKLRRSPQRCFCMSWGPSKEQRSDGYITWGDQNNSIILVKCNDTRYGSFWGQKWCVGNLDGALNRKSCKRSLKKSAISPSPFASFTPRCKEKRGLTKVKALYFMKWHYL